MTNARVGDILLIEPVSDDQVVKVQYPEAVLVNTEIINSLWERVKLGQGVTGWVAKNSKELIISDVKADLSDIADDLYYVPYYPDSRSELCVPLIGKDERILGVINMESQTRDAFDQRHKGMLKALGNQAVIALENIKSKEQLIKGERKNAWEGEISS